MEKLLQYKDILPKISIYKGFFHFETLSGVICNRFWNAHDRCHNLVLA